MGPELWEHGFEMAKGGADLWMESQEEHHDPVDRAVSAVGGAGSMLEVVGGGAQILGALGSGTAAGATMSAVGTGASSVAGPIAAAVAGYKVGTAIDKRHHISDNFSDRMVGSMDERITSQGLVPMDIPGPGGYEAANAFAARTAAENHRHTVGGAVSEALAGYAH